MLPEEILGESPMRMASFSTALDSSMVSDVSSASTSPEWPPSPPDDGGH